MADDPKQRNTPDDDLISLRQNHEVRYWCKKFGIPACDLAKAVTAVGHSAKKVEQWLKENPAEKPAVVQEAMCGRRSVPNRRKKP